MSANTKGGSGSFGVFSDESRVTDSRFRAIAAVSLPADAVEGTNGELGAILNASGVAEFKWVVVRGARNRMCAEKLIDYTVDSFLARGGRVDVLTWDTHDRRHAVQRRDDIKNFERMFFHLHRALMKRRERDSVWHLRPDERVGIDWDTIHECLSSAGRWREHFKHPVLSDVFSDRFYRVRSLKQVRSHEVPLCQLADLFAGMAPYVRDRSAVVNSLLMSRDGTQPLFDEFDATLSPSQSDRERVEVIARLHDGCKRRGLGVSLRETGYLRTPNPKNPINFWNYEPQHVGDVAPTRTKPGG